jgi:hypothetical protein
MESFASGLPIFGNNTVDAAVRLAINLILPDGVSLRLRTLEKDR